MWLHPVPIGIGLGRGGGACNRELPRIPIPRTPVNKGKKRGPVLIYAPALASSAGWLPRQRASFSYRCRLASAAAGAGCAMVTRHDRRILRVALVSSGLAPFEVLCLLGERHTPKRHRQRQHQRRDQQRNALPHLFSPPFLIQEQNRLTSPPARAEVVAGCATGSVRPFSAHLCQGELLSLYTSSGPLSKRAG
jgi:hypothetical protein